MGVQFHGSALRNRTSKAALLTFFLMSSACSTYDRETPPSTRMAMYSNATLTSSCGPRSALSDDNVSVVPVTVPGDELSAFRLSTATGASMLVYHDAASEAQAKFWSVCLGQQLVLLQNELGDNRRSSEWDSVVFTTNPDYTPPRGDDVRTRWIVPYEQDRVERFIQRVVPHEQVHAYQNRNGARLPRWVAEGHATWASYSAMRKMNPSIITEARDKRLADLEGFTGSLSLASWGSVRPKRAAIIRQVNEEDRRRMQEDPNYFPSGSFTFTPDDLESDLGNMLPRYAASLLVFETLEARHGADKINAWISDLTIGEEIITSEIVETTLRERFGEELTSLLAEENFEPASEVGA